VAEDDFF
jgi:hypothetical protein